MDLEFGARRLPYASPELSPKKTHSPRSPHHSATSPASPSRSPSKSSSEPRSPGRDKYGDRYIPYRSQWQGTSPLKDSHVSDSDAPLPSETSREDGSRNTYNLLLRNELLGAHVDSLNNSVFESPPASSSSPNTNTSLGSSQIVSRFSENEPVLKFGLGSSSNDLPSPYSLSPVGVDSQKLLMSPRKVQRKISTVPFKVLDAPELQDDFYLNLLDWSSQNVLAVGLGRCVYLWSACTSQVTKLCELPDNDSVTSVKWMQRGSHVSVGTNSGSVLLWDAAKCRRVRQMTGHTGRVGSLAWNANVLCSGSRDRSIIQRDIRAIDSFTSKLTGHKQEVCGLEWSPTEQYLASGGNDNKLLVWTSGSTTPVHQFKHKAAVKAIAWSPHQHGLLASGGGTADQCIKFWNTLTGQPLQCINTKSQVCNLAWSKTANELVSTHGYSQNHITIWKYPSMTQLATLTGHTMRVLYLALSPDGQTIVTGAGDETLRFWNVFSKARSLKESNSVLSSSLR